MASRAPHALQRYVAFLRGVSPSNCKMPELKAALERAGFTDVQTVLSSGNVLFSAAPAPEQALARQAERAMKQQLGRQFETQVRSLGSLRQLLAKDPCAKLRLPPGTKRVITFLAEAPKTPPKLPVEHDGARILALRERAVFTTYAPSPRGPVFMTLLEKAFGKSITTRTRETLDKIVERDAGGAATDLPSRKRPVRR